MSGPRVALFGAGGYAGLELIKLLTGHPGVELACAASDANAGRALRDLTGAATDLSFVTAAEAKTIAADVALLAVPPEAATALVPALRERGTRIVDLSNAYRASADAAYGLVSLFGDELPAASVIANPGCYATCIITAVAPLVRHALIADDVVVAAGSGVTGAGRSSDEAFSLGELHDNVRAYKVLRHQHVPEIEMALGRIGGGTGPRVILTTHLLPIARGIFATITVRLRAPRTSQELTEVMRRAWASDPTVVVWPTPEDVSIRKVVGTNQTHVGVAAAGDVCVVTASIDNLMKGAAGQAVENLNLMLGLPRMAGLGHLARHA